MSRTVTALYDTKAEAEAARDRLSAAVDVEGRARIIDKTSGGGSDDGHGLHGLALSHEDRHAYHEGIRRGGYMLCAEVDGDEDVDKIVAILEQTSSVDLDERQESWRKEGWQGAAGTAGMASSGTQSLGSSASTGTASTWPRHDRPDRAWLGPEGAGGEDPDRRGAARRRQARGQSRRCAGSHLRPRSAGP
jgi:hypothetical protein